jgi:heptosyltransferase I
MMPVALPRSPRILVVMMSAVGDAVHVLPVIGALRRHYPTASISWVLQPGPASLVEGHPDVDEIIRFERKRGWRAFTDIRRALKGRKFDLVINLQVYLKAGIVTSFADAPVKLGFDRSRARDLNWLMTTHRIPPHAPQHVQDQYFEFLEYLGVPVEPIEWKLGPWPHERAWQQDWAAQFDRPLAALVIGTSNPVKDWVAERWAELADALFEDYHLQPFLVGGRSAGELETERVIRERARHPVVSTLGVSLRQLVATFDASALVISPDTGPMHIAVALDRPVIALAGPFNPKRTGPYRFRDLIVDAYGRPGEDYGIMQQKRPGHMARITVADVLEKVAHWQTTYGDHEQRRHP